MHYCLGRNVHNLVNCEIETYHRVFVLQPKTKIKVHSRKHKQLYIKTIKLITASYRTIL